VSDVVVSDVGGMGWVRGLGCGAAFRSYIAVADVCSLHAPACVRAVSSADEVPIICMQCEVRPTPESMHLNGGACGACAVSSMGIVLQPKSHTGLLLAIML